MAMHGAVHLHGTALTGDVGLNRESEGTELVYVFVIVFCLKTGIAHIGRGCGLVLELGLTSLFVGLKCLVGRTATGIGRSVIGFHILRRVGVWRQLHGVYCHCKTEVCSQQSCGDHKQR